MSQTIFIIFITQKYIQNSFQKLPHKVQVEVQQKVHLHLLFSSLTHYYQIHLNHQMKSKCQLRHLVSQNLEWTYIEVLIQQYMEVLQAFILQMLQMLVHLVFHCRWKPTTELTEGQKFARAQQILDEGYVKLARLNKLLHTRV